MTIVLRILGKKLSDTVAAWESFRANDIHYFDEDTVTPVVTNFGKLEDHLQKCRDLETELHKDNPDGVSRYHSGKSNLCYFERLAMDVQADHHCSPS